MLDKAQTNQILEFVRQKPRTIQEIAHLLDKNWRTANRYVEQIALEVGKGSAYQEALLRDIQIGKRKENFNPFDIYQFVPETHREAYLEINELSKHPSIRYDQLLTKAQHQVLLFSGNLSWMELGPNMIRTIEHLAQRKVQIKILTRVDITSLENTEKALAMNQRVGWDAIHIRHREQPLRSLIVDDQFATLKEVLNPQYIRELKKKMYIFYKIKDPEWVNWLQKVFWHLWNQSIDAEKRLEALKTLQKAQA